MVALMGLVVVSAQNTVVDIAVGSTKITPHW